MEDRVHLACGGNRQCQHAPSSACPRWTGQGRAGHWALGRWALGGLGLHEEHRRHGEGGQGGHQGLAAWLVDMLRVSRRTKTEKECA